VGEPGFYALLYDHLDYAGGPAPGWTRGATLNAALGEPRFVVCAARRSDGATLWARGADTHDAARSLVPPGGVYFDRTGNTPSPMVPIEGWRFDAEPPAPAELQLLEEARSQ
jgi:hypothetical protein